MAPSKQPKKIIVVGAGVGGLALSIYLADRGYRVEILEKQSRPGGRCGQLNAQGHRFDLGATLMLMPRLIESVYSDWGESAQAWLSPKPLDPIYRFHLQKYGRFDWTSDLARLSRQMEALEPGSFQRWLALFSLGCRQYDEFMPRFLGRNFETAASYFTPANLFHFLRLKGHRGLMPLLGKAFRHPALRAVFSFQNIYVGQHPFHSPALYLLLSAMELREGGWYPAGGMHGVAASLAEMARRRGVRLHCNAAVSSVERRNGRATGIVLDGASRVAADVVAINADLPYAYRCLLDEPQEASRLDRKHFTCSALVLHWALRRPARGLGHHNVFLADGYKAGLDQVFEGQGLPEFPHFYINRPTDSDPAAAPPGQDSLSIILPVRHVKDGEPGDWASQAKAARKEVLKRLTEAGIRGIEPSIKFEIAYTPRTWQQGLNLSFGAVFGSLDHSLLQMGYLRPSNRHAGLSNLYFVGGGTQPGSGVPLALASARLTAERILKTVGGPAPDWNPLRY